ncbi:hypothetical protein Dpo_8c00790 [Desulfotignum phosphitoxidans DSM 13687]|uniref:Uncharacterized protein n=2 Tax=Desulfotignum phosphitoxidans TaxID=190898 RepID=S0G2M2_9BACT|nr:hypothetical protein Dpo_8c00790 [Desulfotignum phosphitoxidans DSM 13687]
MPDLHKLNRFIIRVGRIHIGHKELSGQSMDYRKAGLALIEQGVYDTLCSLDPDLIPWDILDQVEVFFHYLDRHVTDDIGFSNYETDAIPDRALDLPAGILDFLDDFLLVADAQAHRFEGSTAYYA